MGSADHSLLPRWYWTVAVLGLAWMLIGLATLAMDVMTMTDEAALQRMSEAQREFYAARPVWLFVVYVVAILSGLIGAAGLLMRKGWSVAALSLSLAAAVVQFGYTLLAMGVLERVGPAQALPLPVAVLVMGALLLWFSRSARRRHWID